MLRSDGQPWIKKIEGIIQLCEQVQFRTSAKTKMKRKYGNSRYSDYGKANSVYR